MASRRRKKGAKKVAPKKRIDWSARPAPPVGSPLRPAYERSAVHRRRAEAAAKALKTKRRNEREREREKQRRREERERRRLEREREAERKKRRRKPTGAPPKRKAPKPPEAPKPPKKRKPPKRPPPERDRVQQIRLELVTRLQVAAKLALEQGPQLVARFWSRAAGDGSIVSAHLRLMGFPEGVEESAVLVEAILRSWTEIRAGWPAGAYVAIDVTFSKTDETEQYFSEIHFELPGLHLTWRKAENFEELRFTALMGLPKIIRKQKWIPQSLVLAVRWANPAVSGSIVKALMTRSHRRRRHQGRS